MNLYTKIMRRAGWAITVVTFLVITFSAAIQETMDPDRCPQFMVCQSHN